MALWSRRRLWCLQMVMYGLILLAPGGCLLFGQPTAVLKPGDSLVYVGETLRVSCEPSQGTSLSAIQFKLASEADSGVAWYLPSENLTRVGSSRVKADITITEEFPPRTNVLCFNDKNLLSSMKVFVEKPLIPVSGFGGSFFDDQPRATLVEVSWSNNAEYYLKPSEIETTADYVQGQKNWTRAERCQNEEAEVCSPPYQGNPFIYFRFTVRHKRANKRPGLDYLQPLYNSSVASVHRFGLADNRKIGPVTKVKVTDVQQTCASVAWELPRFLQFCTVGNPTESDCDAPWCGEQLKDLNYVSNLREKMIRTCETNLYQLELTQVYTGLQTFLEITRNDIGPMEPLQFCDLAAFTMYSLRVRVKDKEINPWSDRSKPVQLTTSEDRPLTGPVVTPTSYHVAAPCDNGRRPVTVFWNAQPESTLRGSLAGYEVISPEETKKLGKGMNFFNGSLPCADGADILIFTVTIAGPSLDPSVIHVPPAASELDSAHLNFAVEEIFGEDRDKRMLHATWNPEAFTRDGLNVTIVFYICEEAEPYTCVQDFRTIEVDGDRGQLTVYNVSTSQGLLGYALQSSEGAKTGIDWTECVYRFHLRPATPTGLQALQGEGPGSIVIKWPNARCDRHSRVFVKRYHLSLCLSLPPGMGDQKQGQHSRNCQNVSLDSAEAISHVFTGLEEGQVYWASLRYESAAGLGLSLVQEVNVAAVGQRAKTSTKQIVVAILGSIGVTLFLGALLFGFCRCKKEKKRVDMLFKIPANNRMKKSTARNTRNHPGDADSGYFGPGVRRTVSKPVSVPPVLPERNQAQGPVAAGSQPRSAAAKAGKWKPQRVRTTTGGGLPADSQSSTKSVRGLDRLVEPYITQVEGVPAKRGTTTSSAAAAAASGTEVCPEDIKLSEGLPTADTHPRETPPGSGLGASVLVHGPGESGAGTARCERPGLASQGHHRAGQSEPERKGEGFDSPGAQMERHSRVFLRSPSHAPVPSPSNNVLVFYVRKERGHNNGKNALALSTAAAGRNRGPDMKGEPGGPSLDILPPQAQEFWAAPSAVGRVSSGQELPEVSMKLRNMCGRSLSSAPTTGQKRERQEPEDGCVYMPLRTPDSTRCDTDSSNSSTCSEDREISSGSSIISNGSSDPQMLETSFAWTEKEDVSNGDSHLKYDTEGYKAQSFLENNPVPSHSTTNGY